jgi:hypothetical protein
VAGREELTVLAEPDVQHHSPAQGPGTEAQLDGSVAWGPVHWGAAIFTIVAVSEFATAHLVMCGMGTYGQGKVPCGLFGKRQGLYAVASENMRAGAAHVRFWFCWAGELVFLLANVSVCFRRGSSQGEAVLVRTDSASGEVWSLAAWRVKLWDPVLYLDRLEMFADSDK